VDGIPLVELGDLPSLDVDINKSLSKDDEIFLTNSYRVFLDFWKLHGFENFLGVKSQKTLRHWRICSSQCSPMKFIKYKIAAFFSFWMGLELPPKPFIEKDSPGIILGGRPGRWCRARCIRKNDLDLSFIVGILYIKKGLPRPDESLLESSKLSTFISLTSPHPFSPVSSYYKKVSESIGEKDRINLRLIMDTCTDIIQQYIPRNSWNDDVMYKPYAPSVRANYVNSRSSHGTLGSLLQDNLIDDIPIDSIDYGNVFEHFNEFGEVGHLDSRAPTDNIAFKLSENYQDRVRYRYKTVYDSVRKAAAHEVTNVSLVSLAEPLKVRTISKGPPLKYFLLHPLQKLLHKSLRNSRQFALTGEPVSVEYLTGMFCGALASGSKFISADYSAATDNLNPVLSMHCVRIISQWINLPPDLESYFEEALTGHFIEYEGYGRRRQLWGQLMGSIVSFPILCIVNFAVCLISWRETVGFGKSFPMKSAPITINGDDALFPGNDDTYALWKSVALMAGLEPSVGKVYYSSNYLNINSTSYKVVNGILLHIPYVNMGLMMGIKRSGKKVGLDEAFSIDSIGAKCRDLINLSPWRLRFRVLRCFIRKNLKLLLSMHVPWFIPESLGGVGLPAQYKTFCVDDPVVINYEGVRFGPSRMDRIGARLLLNGMMGKSVQHISAPQPVITRPLWLSRVNLPKEKLHIVGPVHGFLKKCLTSFNDVAGFLDVAMFYLHPSEVLGESDVAQGMRALRSNERTWSCIRHAVTSSTKGIPPLKLVQAGSVIRPIVLMA